MPAKVFAYRFLNAAGLLLALIFITAAPAFPLGLEKVGAITPSGMDTGLLNPTGLWYDNLRGFLLVANTHARHVVVLNSQGQALKVLERKSDAGLPLAVAGDRDGTLYIAERGSESLKVLPSYDAAVSGEYRNLELSPYRRSSAVQPVALFVDPAGNLYVADRGNRQVLVIDAAGKLKFAITDVGDPADIWVETAGKVLVADPGFGGIRVYGPSGAWLRTIGGGSGQLREPLRVKAMVVDRRGRIWVVEESGQRIKAFDFLGNLLANIEAGLTSPADLAIDDQDNLYVLEQGRNRIAVFRITGF